MVTVPPVLHEQLVWFENKIAETAFIFPFFLVIYLNTLKQYLSKIKNQNISTSQGIPSPGYRLTILHQPGAD